MTLEDLNLLVKIVQDNGFESGSKNQDLARIFETKNYVQLIADFEKCLGKIKDKSKTPHFTLIFFTALLSISLDNTEDIAKILQNKKCYNYLLSGLNMLVSGKSKTLKFDIGLAHESFSNKYEYIRRFAFQLPYWEHCALIFLMKVIYHIDKKEFFKLLMNEKSNFLCIIFFSERENIQFSKSILIEFLNCDDEIKVNAALYKLVLDFNIAYRKYESNQNLESNIELLNKACIDINEIFTTLIIEKRVRLALNLIMVEDIYPSNLISVLSYDSGVLIMQLKIMDINTVKQIFKLLPLSTVDDPIISRFVNNLFKTKLRYFLKEDKGIYEDSMFCDVLNSFDNEELEEIYQYIESLKNGLKISEFDLQVRHVAYCSSERHKANLLKHQKQIKEIITSKSQSV
jgi:hypothetical protein